MKKLGVVLMVVMMLTSCDEELKDILPSMTAEIDGAEWVSVLPAATNKDGNIIITGIASDGETLIITILGDQEGTYELSVAEQGCAAVYKETADASLEGSLAISGSVNLTDVNTQSNNVSGTFEFTILKQGAQMPVTNGVFNKVKLVAAGTD